MQTLKKKEKKKTAIIVTIVTMVLLVLVVGKSYAEYKQEAEVTFINARVADFRVFLTDITATSTNNKIELSYTSSGLNATTECSFGTTKGTYNINATSVDNSKCSKTGLNQNTTYYYKVCTKNNLKQEECKEGSIATKYDPPILSNVTATSTTNSIKLIYTTSGHVEGYACLYGTSSGNLTNSASMTLNECNITGLQPGIIYYYAVGISNNGGRATKYGSIATKVNPPTVTINSATSTYNSIDLSYTISGTVTSKTCKYGTSSGSYTTNGNSQTNSKCSITGLKSNTTYYYQVCANNSGGQDCKTGSINTLKTLADQVSVGDYIYMQPTATVYTIPKDLTGYTSDQTINPSELTLWRVIKKNEDGTIDMVSDEVSSDAIYLKGTVGFRNLVKTLNTIAAQYSNAKFVQSTRHLGFKDQIESCVGYKADQCPSDSGYSSDVDLLEVGLGTMVSKTINGAPAGYWLSSRYRTNQYVGSWIVDSGGKIRFTYLHDLNAANAKTVSSKVRPVVTLKSDTGVNGGSGTAVDPKTLK